MNKKMKGVFILEEGSSDPSFVCFKNAELKKVDWRYEFLKWQNQIFVSADG